MQPTPHAALSNVGNLNRMMLQMLEESLGQTCTSYFRQGVKVSSVGGGSRCVCEREEKEIGKRGKRETKKSLRKRLHGCNAVNGILAFLSGSQSRSQLHGSCQVFVAQLPSKLIRELAHFTNSLCAFIFGVNLWKK